MWRQTPEFGFPERVARRAKKNKIATLNLEIQVLAPLRATRFEIHCSPFYGRDIVTKCCDSKGS